MKQSTSVTKVVLDTNIFIAAAFNRESHSASIIEALRQGQLRMFWNGRTHRETEHLLQKIPRLFWDDFSRLFRQEDCHQGETNPKRFRFVADVEDRKFAALSEVVGAILVTQDKDLLDARRLIRNGISATFRPCCWTFNMRPVVDFVCVGVIVDHPGLFPDILVAADLYHSLRQTSRPRLPA